MHKPKTFDTPQYVTKPWLPPLPLFCEALGEIWASHRLTNEGPVVQRFEAMLAERFLTRNLCLFSNGTLALQIAIQALGVSGEVITTPYSFVASTHALFWNKVRPVFCDVDPIFFNLDPDAVEAAITPWTTAVLAVHVYGNPCQLDRLADICARHHLTLIYDAAHAFGVTVDGRPVSSFGHVSMFSFHATKPFHSFEGGMLAFQDSGLKKKLNYLKNFGFENEMEVVMPGTNAKMSEIHALMGEMLLNNIDSLIAHRSLLTAVYRERLAELPGVVSVPPMTGVTHNHAYMPIRIQADFGISRDAVHEGLRAFNVITRRYFFPLISDFPCYRSVQSSDPLTVARQVSAEILTLPLHQDLSEDDVHRICDALAWLHHTALSRKGHA